MTACEKCDILNVNWCNISSTGCISAKWKTFSHTGKARKDNQILHLIHRQLLLCSLLNGIFLPRCHLLVRQKISQRSWKYQSSASIIEFLCVTKTSQETHLGAKTVSTALLPVSESLATRQWMNSRHECPKLQRKKKHPPVTFQIWCVTSIFGRFLWWKTPNKKSSIIFGGEICLSFVDIFLLKPIASLMNK